ncbi:class IV lanthionine synthetase LanL [Streptomyces sp. NPDC101132]|uniref:class IV lanthionine synthetase LanL n=1 Tax=Streptomyces sp. NPDC101132 TaxID=3366110 RepID=UPI0037FCE5DF
MDTIPAPAGTRAGPTGGPPHDRPHDRPHDPPDGPFADAVRARLDRAGATGWRVETGGFWCRVNPPRHRHRVQGWKLHLSATPLSAPEVLDRAARVLIGHGCAFKFAATVDGVRELVSRHAPRGGGGKFLTAYPEGDEVRLRDLAAELHAATEGLPGPGILSDRPYRPGSLVHYRYGAFTGVPVLGNDGTYEAALLAPDGTLAPDPREAWYAPPAWAPRDPFAAEDAPGVRRPRPGAVLLDGRYEVRRVVRHSFQGGVYRAVDRTTGAAVVVKQGRAHAAADLTGRDARDARRHEARMMELLAPTGVTARPLGLFEQQGDVFLVQEAVPGTTLRRWAADNSRPGEDSWGPGTGAAVRLARDLSSAVAAVHAEGLVLRDLTPSNVMVTPEGRARLIDLELAARPGEAVVRSGTPGYLAPELRRAPAFGPAPGPAADLYGLGATLFCLATGLDPVLPADEPEVRPVRERIGEWLELLAPDNAAARALGPLVLALLDDDPARRPDPASVRARLDAAPGAAADAARADGARAHPVRAGAPRAHPVRAAAPRAHAVRAGGPTAQAARDDAGPPPAVRDDAAAHGGFGEDELKRAVTDALEHLLATMDPEDPDRLWPTGPFAGRADPFTVQHGAAGVLGVLVRAATATGTGTGTAAGQDPALRAAVAAAAGWIGRHVHREPRALPGLYFGRSGTAWALLEAGRLLGDRTTQALARELALRVPVRSPNPDVCHGTSGAGLTQLRFWEATGDERFLDRAREAADTVAGAARERDGGARWTVPAGFDSALAGVSHYGFAHGVAGCGAFLLAAGRSTGEERYLRLAGAAARTLAGAVRSEGGAAYWPADDTRAAHRTHWCSGSSGIGTFLLRAGVANGDDALLSLARRAAEASYRTRRHASPAQCHGLAGDGDFLLDLADATGEESHRERARELAAFTRARHALRDGRAVAPDETGAAVVADYGTGLSGVLAFLLRLRYGGPRLWLPDAAL